MTSQFAPCSTYIDQSPPVLITNEIVSLDSTNDGSSCIHGPEEEDSPIEGCGGPLTAPTPTTCDCDNDNCDEDYWCTTMLTVKVVALEWRWDSPAGQSFRSLDPPVVICEGLNLLSLPSKSPPYCPFESQCIDSITVQGCE